MTNNSWFEPTSFFLGMFFAFWLLIIIIAFSDNLINQANKAIAECERSLPRDQYCTITAIPKTNEYFQ